MYVPNLNINYWAIIVSMAVYFLIGWIWYSQWVFGKTWIREMHLTGEKPGVKEMARSIILTLIACFLISYVFAHGLIVWRPSVWWGINGIPDSPSYGFGLMSAIFTWLGYFVPVYLISAAYEKMSWKLFGINAGYHLVSLLVIGQILAYWW